MTRFVIRRVSHMLLAMAVASFLVFLAVEASPGSMARKALGQFATEEQVREFSKRLQQDRPFEERYLNWIGVLLGLAQDPLSNPDLHLGFDDPRGRQYFGNFGFSIAQKVPVNDVIWDRIANTGLLAGLAYLIIVPMSLLFGIIAGVREGSRTDRSLSFFAILFSSIPEFASGVVLVSLFVVILGWLPGTSTLDQFTGWSITSQLVLPVTVLVIYSFGYITRMMRGSMAEVMNQPYIRTAVLKGLPRHRVILRHALRNAMIAPFTVILLSFNFLITGVIVTEVIFGYPGFGRLLLEAALFERYCHAGGRNDDHGVHCRGHPVHRRHRLHDAQPARPTDVGSTTWPSRKIERPSPRPFPLWVKDLSGRSKTCWVALRCCVNRRLPWSAPSSCCFGFWPPSLHRGSHPSAPTSSIGRLWPTLRLTTSIRWGPTAPGAISSRGLSTVRVRC